MKHHARVLQQRIQIATLGSSRKQPLEGIGGGQQEQQEAGQQQAHDGQHARQQRLGQVRAAQRQQPQRQQAGPQQQRALVPAPRRRKTLPQSRAR
jgi:hypothetical protein